MTRARTASLLSLLPLLAAVLAGCQSQPIWEDDFALGSSRKPTPQTLHMMSRLLVDQNKTEQAEYVLESIISRHPAYAPAFVELAEMQHRQGRADDALSTMQRARLAAPRDAVVANNLGVLLLEAGRTAEARDAFSAAADLDPAEARYRGNLALANALLADVASATTGYSTILRPAEVHWNVAVALEAAGRADLAVEAYDRVHALDRTSGAAEEAARLRQNFTAAPTP